VQNETLLFDVDINLSRFGLRYLRYAQFKAYTHVHNVEVKKITVSQIFLHLVGFLISIVL